MQRVDYHVRFPVASSMAMLLRGDQASFDSQPTPPRYHTPPSSDQVGPILSSAVLGSVADDIVDDVEYSGGGYTDDYGNVTGNFSGAKWISSVSLNYTVEMMTVVAVLLVLVIVVTAAGNAMVGVALFRYRQLRTVSNYLIGNLAMSDFLLATTIFPLSTVSESLGYWPFGRTLCHMWLTLDVLCCTASIWNLCVIAFDRFTATVFPVWYLGLRSAPGRQAALYAVIIWTVAAMVCVPPLLGWSADDLHKFDVTTGVHSCDLFRTRGYVIFSACGSFFVPFVVTLFLYLGILVVLRSRIRKPNNAKDIAAKKAAKTSSSGKSAKSNSIARSLLDTEPKIELASMCGDSCLSIADEAYINAGPSTVTLAESRNRNDDSSKCLDSVDKNIAGDCRIEFASVDADKPKTSSSNSGRSHQLTVYDSNGAKTSLNGSDMLSVPSNVKRSATMLLSTSPKSAADSLTNPPAPVVSIRPSRSFCLSPFAKRKTNSADNVEADDEARENKLMKAQLRQQRQQRVSYERREMRATIRMAIIIAIFCGFWLGFFVVYLVRGCCDDCQIPRALDAFFFWLGYSNSSVNPILYTIFNDDFRNAFQKILGIGGKGNKNGQKARNSVGRKN